MGTELALPQLSLPKLINPMSSASLQWPHTADYHRVQPGCHTGAQDPSEVQWQRVCQCKYLILQRKFLPIAKFLVSIVMPSYVHAPPSSRFGGMF